VSGTLDRFLKGGGDPENRNARERSPFKVVGLAAVTTTGVIGFDVGSDSFYSPPIRNDR